MAGSVNKVILVGNLGRDPEVRTFQNGGKVCNLRIATSENWKDRNTGERRERTEWHSVAIFSEPLARIAEQYLRKGSKVYLEGQLETRKWQDQTGQDRYTTEVVANEMQMLDSRDNSQANVVPASQYGLKPAQQMAAPQPAQHQPPPPPGAMDSFDDPDIPF